MQVSAIAAFKDNYIWCVHNLQSALIIDPGESDVVLDFLARAKLRLEAIFITHHHRDHHAGLADLLAEQQVPVYGPALENISGITHRVAEPMQINLPQLGLTFKVLDTPGHTRGHICYYTPGLLFCGDTLFAAGCGRLFEGEPKTLLASLEKLACLPSQTQVYPAHEYTQANLQFAEKLEPDNPEIKAKLKRIKHLRELGFPSLPSTLAEEKLTNPFLRCQEPNIIAAAEGYAKQKLKPPSEVFAVLRAWKNLV